MLSTYYASKAEVYLEIRRHCSKEFFNKYSDKIYFCYRKEYEPLFGKRAFNDIKKIVQEFKDFFGEE